MNRTVVLFRALGQPVRLHIVLELLERPRCVNDLVGVVPRAQGTVSRHLQVLKAAGVVVSRQDGQRSIYGLRDPHTLRDVIGAAGHHQQGGRR